MTPKILLIKEVPNPFASKLQKILGDEAEVVTSPNGLMGIFDFQRIRPWITIIDENLSDVSGLSVSTILKDTGVENSLVYILVRKKILENTKADRFYDAKTSPAILCEQVKRDLAMMKDNIFGKEKNDGLEYATYQQAKMLPNFIRNECFSVEYVFSAFDKLSGDSVNFWYDKKKDPDHLYGYLFDCEGHNVSSFGQVGSAWMLLRKNMESYQNGEIANLGGVMDVVNKDYIHLTPIKSLVPSIVFCFDFGKKELKFSTAGIPCVFLRRKGQDAFEPAKFQSNSIGYEAEGRFEEHSIPLEQLEDVIFTSDGLSDLVADREDGELGSAKHDDVSAIHVHLSLSVTE